MESKLTSKEISWNNYCVKCCGESCSSIFGKIVRSTNTVSFMAYLISKLNLSLDSQSVLLCPHVQPTDSRKIFIHGPSVSCLVSLPTLWHTLIAGSWSHRLQSLDCRASNVLYTSQITIDSFRLSTLFPLKHFSIISGSSYLLSPAH